MNLCNVNNFYLIIAEKSKAAKKIAEALSNKPVLCRKYGVNYWVLNINKMEYYVVVPAAGHLFGLEGNSGFPVYDAEWKPLWMVDKSAYYTKKYYQLISELSRRAIGFINACDYDIEGSVIGYLIIKYLGDIRKAKRMKFSTLTKYDIVNSFRNMGSLDYNMINAGISRHKIDWLWGINISRALMKALQDSVNKKVILSAGRVQSPTLVKVVNSEIERNLYIPFPKFSVSIKLKFNDRLIDVNLNKEFEKISDAQSFLNKLINKKVRVNYIESKVKTIERPPPFNLTDLQVEAGRLYGISPYNVERIAEDLYLDGLISYPRTNSQKIPSTVNIYDIVNNLEKSYYKDLIYILNKITNRNYIVKQGAKEDPAHPAIYPTGEMPKGLSGNKRKIYDLIVRRFLASLSKDAKLVTISYWINVIDFPLNFTISYNRIIERNWLDIYPYHSFKEDEIIHLFKNEEGVIVSGKIKTILSKPSNRYTKVSLLKWMEASGLGTEATRGRIIEILIKRKYLRVNGKYLVPTKLGLYVAEILSKFFPDIVDIKMTADMENKLEMIKMGKLTQEEVIKYNIERLNKFIEEYKFNKNEIGLSLAKALGFVKYNKCKYCELESYREDLCTYHYLAKQKLLESIRIWRERTNYEDKEIIERIGKSKSVGKYIKDILAELIDDESHAKQKK